MGVDPQAGPSAENRPGIGDKALVARAAPLAGTLGQWRDEWAIDQQVRQLKGRADRWLGTPAESFEGVAGVHRRMDTASLDAAQQGGEANRLKKRLAS